MRHGIICWNILNLCWHPGNLKLSNFFSFLVQQQSNQKKLMKMDSLCYFSLYHKLKLGALGSCHVCYLLPKIQSWRKRKHVLKVIFTLQSVIWTFRNIILRQSIGYSLLKNVLCSKRYKIICSALKMSLIFLGWNVALISDFYFKVKDLILYH